MTTNIFDNINSNQLIIQGKCKMSKIPVVTVYRYYFKIFKKEIKLAYEVIDGEVIFKEKPRKNDQVVITFKYEEEQNEKFRW